MYDKVQVHLRFFFLNFYFNTLFFFFSVMCVLSWVWSLPRKQIYLKKKRRNSKTQFIKYQNTHFIDSNSIFGILNYVNFVAEISKMAYVLQDVYDWYRDLMENKSGMYLHKFYILVIRFNQKCLRKNKIKKKKLKCCSSESKATKILL